jgi:hypothetical protein
MSTSSKSAPQTRAADFRVILALSVDMMHGIQAGAGNRCAGIRSTSVDSHMQAARTHGKPCAVQPEVQPDARLDPNAAIES